MAFGGTEVLLLLLLALASYIQAMTGFAFALIVMATVPALGLAPIDVTALLVSALGLVSSLTGLRGGEWRSINRHALTWFMLPCLPATLAGLWLLSEISGDQRGLLQAFLGLCIIGSSLMMMYRVRQLDEPTGWTGFAFTGVLSGLMGGLFAAFGPPITFTMYRQPFSVATIRSTLLCVFGITCLLRLVAALWIGPVPESLVGLCVLGTPAVILSALAARHYPLPLSNLAMRRLAFGLLLISGIGLTVRGLSY